MKQFLMIFAVVASLCVLGSCSNDDNGLKGGKVSGNCELDGKKINLKYGYLLLEDDYRTLVFYDKDVSIYFYTDNEDVPKEDICYLEIENWYNRGKWNIEEVEIGYKINFKKETGTVYDIDDESIINEYMTLSLDGSKVACSAYSLPMAKYDIDSGDDLGEAAATFDLSGNLTEVDLDEDEDTRSFELSNNVIMTVVSDPQQIARLKALTHKK